MVLLEKIGDWTVDRLAGFITKTITDSPSQLPTNVKASTITAARTLVVEDQISLSPQAIAYLKTKLGL